MKVQASLGVVTVVFSFDPRPATAPSRALHVLLSGRALPRVGLDAKERFADAAVRAIGGIGVDVGRGAKNRVSLVGLEDDPARSRSVSPIYCLTTPFAPDIEPAAWAQMGRGLKLTAPDAGALRLAFDRLRSDSRQLAGAAALLGEIFTGDDLLRVHIALHGGPEGSERTFRRRIQELRDAGVLKPVRSNEISGLRSKVERFRSASGTGGRPPELLRYSGGGQDEQLVTLRARRG